jgi:hypothetical protein
VITFNPLKFGNGYDTWVVVLRVVMLSSVLLVTNVSNQSPPSSGDKLLPRKC